MVLMEEGIKGFQPQANSRSKERRSREVTASQEDPSDAVGIQDTQEMAHETRGFCHCLDIDVLKSLGFLFVLFCL
jgi:hypothetical protein